MTSELAKQEFPGFSALLVGQWLKHSSWTKTQEVVGSIPRLGLGLAVEFGAKQATSV